MTQPAAINFGQCWGTTSGQDLSMPAYWATGNQCVAEAILRRWSTNQGQLIDDPGYGFNLTDLLGDDLDVRGLAYAQQQAAAEAQKDERVLGATVTITLTVAGLLTIAGTITTASGPFSMVVSVSNVSTTLLLVAP